eukprot:TRINITY_DN5940_c0_g1_i1.p1 TRINITY_DN5940_c0_g1~~TRINITY_DN5940_c0_g1_i1.p1  ORF type:complete len:529 (+),score=122.32 TRINITY_DN5940_c0_g1_i1:117-1589(+)
MKYAAAAALVVAAVTVSVLYSMNSDDDDSLKSNVQHTYSDINIIHVTDTHGWLSGHRRETELDADYGDFVSFINRMQRGADKVKKDLFIFDTGDLTDGTGLSDATPTHGEYVFPIIQTVPFTALSVGNHELYTRPTVDFMRSSGFISHWEGRYLTSNIRNPTSLTSLGSNYALVSGKYGKNILVYGFLYNMADNTEAVVVLTVENTLQEQWFVQSLSTPNVDAIVVLAHMDLANSLVSVILGAIRAVQPTRPVVFLTGHTHYRGFQQYDTSAVGLISGKYFDTIGLVGVNLTTTPTFSSEYITAGLTQLMTKTGTTSKNFTTSDGEKTKAKIDEARQALGLDNVVGCAPQTYRRSSELNQPESLWGLFLYQVAPQNLFLSGKTNLQWHAASSGGFRYDLYAGENIVDDIFTMSPFRNQWQVIENLSGAVLLDMLNYLNTMSLFAVHRDRLFDWMADAGLSGCGRGAFVTKLPARPTAALFGRLSVQARSV